MVYDKSVLETAAEITKGCQGGHNSFCDARCPMHTDPFAYVNLIGEGKLTEAILKIREKLFLPGTLGRVCSHPCEDACRRNTEYGQPISIAALKRYAADHADSEELWDISKKPASGKKVAVIGSGPAGAQAAVDLAKDGHGVTIFEKMDFVGGMLRYGIPEYRLPRAVIDLEYSYLKKLGVEFRMGCEVGKDVAFADLRKDFDAVLIAVGAQKGLVPTIPGGDLKGVIQALDLLREVSIRKEYPLEPTGGQTKRAAVIGGGNVAMDAARTIRRLGAEKVYIVYRRSREEMPADDVEIHEAMEEGVEFMYLAAPKAIEGSGKAERLVCERMKLGEPDASGRPSPVAVGEEFVLEIDNVVFATGQATDAYFVGDTVKTGRAGRFQTDPDTLETSAQGIFAAGDCAGSTIAVEAMALGRKAAISVSRFLAGQDLKAGRDFEKEYAFETKLDIPLPDDVQDVPRKHTGTLAPDERVKSFDEYNLGFDGVTATEESARCLKCECKHCMTECIMLNDFTAYPGALLKKFLEDGDMQPLIAYSCNMCDQCTLVCPKEYKFADLFGAMRKDMVKANGGESPMPGHKAIKMHQLLGFSRLFAVKRKGAKV